jgi:hypothetical protein
LLNVRESAPLTVVVFPFDVAMITDGNDRTVVVSPGSSATGRLTEPAWASKAPKPETRNAAAWVRKRKRLSSIRFLLVLDMRP